MDCSSTHTIFQAQKQQVIQLWCSCELHCLNIAVADQYLIHLVGCVPNAPLSLYSTILSCRTWKKVVHLQVAICDISIVWVSGEVMSSFFILSEVWLCDFMRLGEVGVCFFVTGYEQLITALSCARNRVSGIELTLSIKQHFPLNREKNANGAVPW